MLAKPSSEIRVAAGRAPVATLAAFTGEMPTVVIRWLSVKV